jgi:tetratricopeptide (TPR) repeat protein
MRLRIWPVRSTDDVGKLIRLGDIARDKRQWNIAAAHYSRAVKLNPMLWGIWTQLGHALREAGNLQNAESCYRRAIELGPTDDGDPHLFLGRTLKAQNKLHEATITYLESLKLCDRRARPELQELGLPDSVIDHVLYIAKADWPPATIEAIWGRRLDEAALDPLPEVPAGYPDGWMSHIELVILYNLSLNSPGPVLEVGPWIGRSTTAICCGLRDRLAGRVPFDCVDFGHVGVEDWTTAFGGLPGRTEDATKFTGPLEHPGGSLAVLIAGLKENKILDQVSTIVRGDFSKLPFTRFYSLIFCDTIHDREEAERHVPKLARLALPDAVIVIDDVVDEGFADFICGFLPPSKRILLHNIDKYSKHLLVKLDPTARPRPSQVPVDEVEGGSR